MKYLQDLNTAQYEAVVAADGPQMIIAGAGSGKTRVLTYRLAYLIDQKYADSFELLALTFTNKAAKEMRERIEKLIGGEAKNIWMGTFHSVFSRILRREAEKLGYTSSFTIYDEEDARGLVTRIIKELKLDDKKFKPKLVVNQISGAKNTLINPEEYALNYVTDSFTNIVSRIYKIYTTRLFESNAMDFDDLLVKPIELFNKFPEILHKYQHRFKYILVDEYQDTNHAQYVITKMLAGVWQNICVVGDDAQSIYSFRGANIQNILNFQKDYPEAKVYKLEQNYRSTQTIVHAANEVILKNKNQIQKTVFTDNEAGDKINILEASSEQEEARMVSNAIREQKMRHNLNNKDFAILYRTNAQSRAIETELRRSGTKYKIFGGLSFYRRKEIKDALAYFKLAVNPKDEAALQRVINYPTRGIGKTTLEKLTVLADEHQLSLWECLLNVAQWGFAARTQNAISQFTLAVQNYGVAARNKDAYEAGSYILQHSGLLKELHQENSIESLTRWENVQELLNAAKEFTENEGNEEKNLSTFLAEIALFSDQDEETEDNDYVTLMTIHAAKGLEFPSVFIMGLEEELFPNFMALQSREDLEEERRLFYVAITRAKQKLSLSFAKFRYRFGNAQFNEPSRFLEEIDPKYLHFPKLQPKTSESGPRTLGRSAMQRSQYAKPRQNTQEKQKKQSFQGDDLTALAIGMQVQHPKFGKGSVRSLEGTGSGRKATVEFRQSGEKVLLLKYAKMKILK